MYCAIKSFVERAVFHFERQKALASRPGGCRLECQANYLINLTALMLCVGVLTTRWPGPGPSLVFPSRGPISGSHHEQRRKAEERKADYEALQSDLPATNCSKAATLDIQSASESRGNHE